MTLKVQTRDQNSVTYGSLNDSSFSLRVKNVVVDKNIQGNTVSNSATDIIVGFDNIVTVAGQKLVDKVAIRVRISSSMGSLEAALAAFKQILSPGQVDAMLTDGTFAGFEPEAPLALSWNPHNVG